ncbi:hypothetical protein EUTSA_v10011830mg [Eutrema salsugineum]|uniref:Uncharacterized protein n=1 Tax=Eutrema salsugineum TaxID=72664 RepID=V4KL09_EUTSA|nr:uncharacterized protein LOC18011445 [Eutrema salsugineum]ESQ30607.1 hypothetical protein EUTSA_v10011830mg [Eutrema salsugineum]
MDQATPEHNTSSSHKRLSVSYLVSLMVLCARHANRLSKKLKLKTKKRTHIKDSGDGERFRWNLTSSPMRSPRAKELFTALSNKAMTMVGRKNTGYGGGFKPEKKKAAAMEEEAEEHGLWQREILMGGKCEPLDFSGAIYYDCNGRQLKEVPPRSPRGTPLPIYPTRS